MWVIHWGVLIWGHYLASLKEIAGCGGRYREILIEVHVWEVPRWRSLLEVIDRGHCWCYWYHWFRVNGGRSLLAIISWEGRSSVGDH